MKQKPAFISPMLCKVVTELPKAEGWVYEVERGGCRSIVVKNVRQVELFAANGKRIYCPEAERAVQEAHPKTAVIDCELVAITPHNGDKAGLRVYAFDLLHLDGRDLTNQPLERRKSQLCTVTMESPLLFSPSLNGDPDQLVEEVRQLSLEGVIAKLKGSFYESGKCTGAWMKMRVRPPQSRPRPTRRSRSGLLTPARRAALRGATQAREASPR